MTTACLGRLNTLAVTGQAPAGRLDGKLFRHCRSTESQLEGPVDTSATGRWFGRPR